MMQQVTSKGVVMEKNLGHPDKFKATFRHVKPLRIYKALIYTSSSQPKLGNVITW